MARIPNSSERATWRSERLSNWSEVSAVPVGHSFSVRQAIVIAHFCASSRACSPNSAGQDSAVIILFLFSKVSLAVWVQLTRSGIGITNNTKQAGINGGLQVSNYSHSPLMRQIWNTITALWAAFNIDRFGRRPLMLCAQAWMVLCFVIWTILSARFAQTGKSGYGNGTIAMIFLFFAGANTAWQASLRFIPVVVHHLTPCRVW